METFIHKINAKTLTEVLVQLTFADVVLAMVRGLRRRYVEVNMETYGSFYEGVCYGCAATNTICELTGVVFKDECIECETTRAAYILGRLEGYVDKWWLRCCDYSSLLDASNLGCFEQAIDDLRRGNAGAYFKEILLRMKDIHGTPIRPLAVEIPFGYKPGPCLEDNYVEEDLLKWEKSVAGLPRSAVGLELERLSVW